MKASDKSVRDFPITCTADERVAEVVTRIAGRIINRMSVLKGEWEHPPGDTIGNRYYDRRQLIRRKLEEAGCDFADEGGANLERIADGHVSVLEKVWPVPR